MHALRAPVAFDGTDFLPDGATVLVEGDTILGVEPAAYDVPFDCTVITYEGTLLPGLIDAHVHLVSNGDVGALEAVGSMTPAEIDAVIGQSLRAQAARGVTTVRDLGDRDYLTLPFRDRAEAGLPRIVAAGPPITAPGGHCHYLGCAAATPDELAAEVRRHHERGVDAIKVMASGGFLTPGTDVSAAQYELAELRAVVEAAHGVGLPVLAHAHSLHAIELAIEARVDGIEHYSGVAADSWGVPDPVIERTAAAGIVVDPTMGMDPAVVALMPGPPPPFVPVLERLGLDWEAATRRRYADVGRLRELGVTVVTGVDAGAAPPKRHGGACFAVLDLVEAGWPLADALATATSGAADACGVGSVTGALRAGLAADLLVVDGDLRADPTGLCRPLSVSVRGRSVVPAAVPA